MFVQLITRVLRNNMDVIAVELVDEPNLIRVQSAKAWARAMKTRLHMKSLMTMKPQAAG
jgi:hypothetical protein